MSFKYVRNTYFFIDAIKKLHMYLLHMSILYVSCMKFSTNRFVRNFIQPTYKIDMCPLTCEKHMLF